MVLLCLDQRDFSRFNNESYSGNDMIYNKNNHTIQQIKDLTQ